MTRLARLAAAIDREIHEDIYRDLAEDDGLTTQDLETLMNKGLIERCVKMDNEEIADILEELNRKTAKLEDFRVYVAMLEAELAKEGVVVTRPNLDTNPETWSPFRREES